MGDDHHDQPMFEFRPLGVGVRTYSTPMNVSWPFPRKLLVYREGLAFVLFSAETWVPRERITRLLRGPGYIRVKWRFEDDIASATASDWFRITQIASAFEQAGYTFGAPD